MTLEEAVRKGELVPIRCVRVKTNIDLSRVRFNQVQYNPRDIENSVMIPDRDDLVVRTYLDHVPERRAVVFCVNVRHGEQMAERFRDHDVPAASVSGRDPEQRRQKTLQAFKGGSLQVLCACDILNEGWDCPAVEALFMARPTLSKILYLQQLGRGTRKSPDTGKKCLYVFDFVDNAGRYNAALSLHRLAGKKTYRPGRWFSRRTGSETRKSSLLAAARSPMPSWISVSTRSITRKWTSSTGRRRFAA